MLSFRRCPSTLRQTIASSIRTSTQSQASILSRSEPSQWTQTLSQSRSLLRTSTACFSTSVPRTQQAPARASFVVGQESPEGQRPITKFQHLQTLGLVDEKIVSTLTRQLGFEDMTQVQSLTISEAMKGIDVLAQAKTGTGKTIAFMLPIIQRILNADPSLAQATSNFGGRDGGYGGRDGRGYNTNRGRNFGDRRGNGRSDIRAIVISPTRELAEQIAVEAKKLVSNTGVKVQVAVGGTQKSEHLRNMDREGCHILVATPGRLTDLLSDPRSRVAAPNLEALTLDEADRLMDDGFWPAIQEIQKLLPDPRQKDRQTLMFSATISRDIAMLAQSVLKPNHHYVHTVSENEAPTHERVPQKIIVTNGLENDTPALYELVVKSVMAAKADGSKRPFKAIVYYNSTAEQDTTFKVFLDMKHRARQAPRDSPLNSLSGVMMLGISSRNSQAQRQRAADNFRTADSAILFSSDVTARGMDFPNVTHVIQMGIAMSSDTYVHRIGRTGRAGKEGEAWLILPRDMHKDHQYNTILRSFPIETDHTIENAKVDLRRALESGIYNSPLDAVQTVRESYSTIDEEGITFAYRGMLGALQKLSSKKWLFDSATTLAKAIWGLPALPYTSPETLQKIGLKELMSPSARSSRRGSGGRSSGGFDDRQFPPSGGFGGRSSGGGFGGGYGGRSGGYGDRSGGFRGERDYGRGESGGYGNRDRGGYGERERGGFGGSRY